MRALPPSHQNKAQDILIIAEGVVNEIRLDPKDADQVWWLDPETKEAVKLVFEGQSDDFIIVFDHRKTSVEALNEGIDAFDAVFQRGNCLGRFAKKKSQYIALADQDDPKTDIKPLITGIVLTRVPFDRSKYRVMAEGKAYHLDTGICFCRQLPVSSG